MAGSSRSSTTHSYEEDESVYPFDTAIPRCVYRDCLWGVSVPGLVNALDELVYFCVQLNSHMA